MYQDGDIITNFNNGIDRTVGKILDAYNRYNMICTLCKDVKEEHDQDGRVDLST